MKTLRQTTRLLWLILLLSASAAATNWIADFIDSLLFTSSHSNSWQVRGSALNNNNAEHVDRELPSAAASMDALYINCGSRSAVIDSVGQEWQADRYFTNGVPRFHWTGLLEHDGSIFQTVRTTMNWFLWFRISNEPLTYEVRLPAGQEISLTLYFTESFNFWLWLTGTVPLLDVIVQNTLAFGDLELIADGNASRTLRVKTSATTSSDGKLTFAIASDNADPTLSAFKIEATSSIDTAVFPLASPTPMDNVVFPLASPTGTPNRS